VSEDWAAVGEAVAGRMRERTMTQKQLAERSKVSPATIRHIQHNTGHHRHNARTLEALSGALGWPPQYLDDVLHGRPQQAAEQVTDEAALRSRLDAMEELLHKISVVIEQRLGNVVDVIYNSGSEVDITIEIKHARHDR
jgi:transcriptional regulator with XRE-family HTH domain